jgi:anhydro-N-acetylmuramic acid kinase
VIVVGLMSGTSCDAVEVAAADFGLDGDDLTMGPLGSLTHDYPDELRRALLQGGGDAAMVCRLDTLVGKELATAAERGNNELCDGSAGLVASHGHTLWHWIDDGRVEGTLQVGRPAWIAQRTGLPVAADFRARDVAEGGQGAPLLSTFDLLALAGHGSAVVAALNLGGIANVTIVGPDVTLAYDIGPGNALIDAAAAHFSGGHKLMDHDGERAGRGRIDDELVDDLMADRYFDAAPPKSTGKEKFNLAYLLEALRDRDLAADDVIATVTAVTARSVARELARHGVTSVVASGGGTSNPALMRMLRAAAEGVTIETTEAWGIPPQAKEAYGFALLGWLTYHGLPGNVPACTGAKATAVLGTIAPGRSGIELPPSPAKAPVRFTMAPR